MKENKNTFFLSETEEIFKILDSDKNGYIDKKEFENNLHKIKSKFSKKVTDLIFLECDLNKNGKITLEELKHFVKTKDAVLFDLFNYLDSEKKGFINKRKLKKSFKLLNYNIKKRHIDKLIEKINLENAKKITLNKKKIQALIKKNKKNPEKLKEYKNLLQNINNLNTNKKLTEQFINNIDRNNDNKITYTDFIKYHHIYPIENIRNIFDEFDREGIDLGESDIFHSTVSSLTPFLTISAAFGARVISRTLTAPFERVKIEMQVNEKKFSETFLDIKKHGWKGFFQGNGTNIMKVLPELTFKLLTYNFLQKTISKDKKNPTVKERMLSGILAGAFAQTLIYSFDITKTRLTLTGKTVYKGTFDCITQIIKKEGFLKRFSKKDF